MSLHDLLARGYFPKELPNPFTTSSFANLITAHSAPLPGDFGLTISASVKKFPKLPSSKPCRYSHARRGLLRRPLAILNPLHFSLLCTEIVQYWNDLLPSILGSKFSATAPVFSSTGRALQGKYSQKERPSLARQTRLNNRFILKTDITRCYPSIYTHSIPWALHTKKVAKGERSPKLLGNRLDFLVRMGQDQQTMGIPIGPDTSLLLAELLLHCCDGALSAKSPTIKGHRFIDDYELGFRDRSAAEDAFHSLDTCIGEYELALNEKKTKIIELPMPLDSTSVATLRTFTFRSTRGYEATDIHTYFDQAFALHYSDPEESILNYAIGRIHREKKRIHPDNWPLLQNLLLLCIPPEPACLSYALGCIIDHHNAGANIDRDGLEEILNTIIIERTPLGHSSEVSWALWGCLALGLHLHTSAVEILERCEDSTSILLALHCEQQKLTLSPLDKTHWTGFMNQEGLYDEHWLFVYEANVKGWLHGAGAKDFVAADKNFGFLKANGVSFYDVTLATPPSQDGPSPSPITPALSLASPDGFDLDNYVPIGI